MHISVVNRERARPRLERIAQLHGAGLTQAEIGRVLGISRERARQLLLTAREHGLIAESKLSPVEDSPHT